MASFSFNGTSGDCWQADDFGLVSGGTFLWAGGTSNIGFDVITWIPFTINGIYRGAKITSATLTVVATITRSDSVSAKIGCELSANPSTPTTEADIKGRTLTTNYLTKSFEAQNTGDTYSYDITTAVQEVINLPGWTGGNTLAVLLKGSSNLDHRRQWAAFENATYAQPKLDIVINSFIPITADVF